MSYLLISVPTDKTDKTTKQKLEAAVDKYSNKVTYFKIPQLKIGTLDQLMQLSDELVKLDSQGEVVVKKIERSFYDMLEQKPTKQEQKHKSKDKSKNKSTKSKAELRVGLTIHKPRKGNQPDTVNLLPNDYVQQFQWDRLYDSSKPIGILSDDMNKIIIKADDDLKNQMASYGDFRNQLEAIERKETGTLMVKPLGEFVTKKDMVESEHLTTLMVVIPKNREDFFLQNYELLERQTNDTIKANASKQQERQSQTNPERKMSQEEEKEEKVPNLETAKDKSARLKQEEEAEAQKKKEEEERIAQEKMKRLNAMCENVIPRSAKVLHSESDFCLYRIVAFKKGEQKLKRLLRSERFTVRQFKFDSGEVKAAKRRKKVLEEKRNKAWNTVLQWCKVYFERIFKMWIHIKALRCFVETILRYGLPPDYQAFLIQTKGRTQEKLRAALKILYAKHGNASLMDEDKSKDTIVTTGIAGLSGEFYPYVSLDLNLTNER